MTSVWPSLALTAAPLPLELPKDGDLAGATDAEPRAWLASGAEFAGLFGALLGSELPGPDFDEQDSSPEFPAAGEGFEFSKPAPLCQPTAAYAPDSSVSSAFSKPAPLHPLTAGSAGAQESQPRPDRSHLPAVSLPFAADTADTEAGWVAENSVQERTVGLLPTVVASVPARQVPPADAPEALASRPNAPRASSEETATASAPAMPEARLQYEPLPARPVAAPAREVQRARRPPDARQEDLLVVAGSSAPTPMNTTAVSDAPRPAPTAESVPPAGGLPEPRVQDGPRELAPTGGENAARRDATGTPQALAMILPSRELLRGEPVFAVRILPSEPASVRNGQPEVEVPVAMKAELSLTREPVADWRPGDTERVPPTLQARGVLSRRHAEGFESTPGRVFEFPAQRRELPAAMAVAVSRPLSPEVPAELAPPETSQSRATTSQTAPLEEQPQSSVRRITLQLDGASGGRVRLDVRDRAGEIQVAVSARGAALAATLREGAAQLVSGLQARGFAAELLAGNTAAASSWGAGEGSAREETNPDSAAPPSGWEHGSGEGHGGRRRQAQEPDEESRN